MTANMWEDIVRFNDRHFPEWRNTSLVYLTNALAGEVGELCNDSKHLAGGGTNKRTPSRADLIAEAADVFIYLALISEVLGYDEQGFRDAVSRKVFKNYERMEGKI